jgi:ribosomal-protein-alanine N-acetyltransferase
VSTVKDSPSTNPTPLTVGIEPMRRRHLRSVVLIERADIHPGWSVGLFLSELSRSDDRTYLVATVDGKVVGFAGALYIDDDAHIATVSVDPDVRGRRVATRLVRALVSDALARRCTAMTLEVRASNEPAIALYRTFGFAPVGVRKNYYAELKEDALIMWAHEIQSDEFEVRLDGIDARLNQQTEGKGAAS